MYRNFSFFFFLPNSVLTSSFFCSDEFSSFALIYVRLLSSGLIFRVLHLYSLQEIHIRELNHWVLNLPLNSVSKNIEESLVFHCGFKLTQKKEKGKKREKSSKNILK